MLRRLRLKLTLAYSPWQGSLDQLHSSTVVNATSLSGWLQLNDASLRSQGAQRDSLCAFAGQVHAWKRVVARVVIGGRTAELVLERDHAGRMDEALRHRN